MVIIELTGPLGAGKGTVAAYLEAKGFQKVVMSDIVREEAQKRGLPLAREVLQDVANALRERYGGNVLAVQTIERINGGRDCVIDGIRNPGEIEEFQKIESFVLIAIDAPVDQRHVWIAERLRKEGRAEDPKMKEELERLMARELGKGEAASGQQVAACVARRCHRYE